MEGFALETAARAIGKRNEELAFWATHSGAEVDLFWQEHGKNWAIEVKYADAPRCTPSMRSAMKDLELAHLWVVYPGDRAYALAEGISALPVAEAGGTWDYVLRRLTDDDRQPIVDVAPAENSPPTPPHAGGRSRVTITRLMRFAYPPACGGGRKAATPKASPLRGEIPEEAGICPGQQFDVFRLGNAIELAPIKDIRSARGCLPGLNTDSIPEEDRS